MSRVHPVIISLFATPQIKDRKDRDTQMATWDGSQRRYFQTKLVGIDMTDVFSVTAAWDKPSYNAGNLITGTISGGDVLTTTTITQETVGPVTVPIVAADGATATAVFPAVQVSLTSTKTTPESVVIDTSRSIVDSATPVHNWVVSANKLSITAVA